MLNETEMVCKIEDLPTMVTEIPLHYTFGTAGQGMLNETEKVCKTDDLQTIITEIPLHYTFRTAGPEMLEVTKMVYKTNDLPTMVTEIPLHYTFGTAGQEMLEETEMVCKTDDLQTIVTEIPLHYTFRKAGQEMLEETEMVCKTDDLQTIVTEIPLHYTFQKAGQEMQEETEMVCKTDDLQTIITEIPLHYTFQKAGQETLEETDMVCKTEHLPTVVTAQPDQTTASSHKAKNKKLECIHCGVTFCNECSFRRHVKRKHNGISTKPSSSVETSVGHESEDQRTALNMKPQCVKCNIMFNNDHNFYTHMEQIHGSTSQKTTLVGIKPDYVCSICHKTYTYKSSLTRHMREVHWRTNVPAIASCRICKMIVCKTSLAHHMEIAHRKTSVVKCHLCNRICPDLEVLQQHMYSLHPDSRDTGTKSVEGSDEFEGTALNDQFYDSSAFTIQSQKDETEVETSVLLDGKVIAKCKVVDGNRVVCTLCSSKLSSLTTHLRSVHKLPRTLVTVCNFCCRVFPDKTEFNLHTRVAHPPDSSSRLPSGSMLRLDEMNEKDRIKCPICQRRLYTRSLFPLHLIECHLMKGIKQCDNCLLFFADQKSLVDHIDSVHPGWRRLIDSSLKVVEFVGDHAMISGTETESIAPSEIETVGLSEGRFNLRIGMSSCGQSSRPTTSTTTTTTSRKSKAVVRRPMGMMCHLCCKRFRCKRELSLHRTLNHFDSGDNLRGEFVCRKCGVSFVYKNSLMLHMVNSHYTGDPICDEQEGHLSQCKICHRKFSREILKLHYLRVHNVNSTMVQVEHEKGDEDNNNNTNRSVLTEKEDRENNIVTENVDKSTNNRCHICRETSTSGYSLLLHLSNHISLGMDRCLKINQRTIRGTQLQTCPERQRQRRHFTGRRDDSAMEMMMRPPPNMTCEICHDSFSKSSLHVVENHPFVVGLASSSSRPGPVKDMSHCVGYECSICYQTLETPDEFTVHMWAVHATNFDLTKKERYNCRWPYATLIKTVD